MTASGVVIRTPVSEFRIIGRGTKGVRVMRLDEKDKVVGIAFVSAEMVNGDGTGTVTRRTVRNNPAVSFFYYGEKHMNDSSHPDNKNLR